MDHVQKRKTKIKRGMAVEIRMTVCEIFLNGWRSSQIILRTQKCLLRTQNRKRPTKVVSNSLKHSVYTHSPKDRNCEICLRTKMTRAPCRRRTGEAPPRAEKFGDPITADHKVLNEEGESRAVTKAKSYLYNSLEFGKSCEDLSWNQRTSTRHRSETDGTAESSTQNKRRDVCCHVTIRLG